MFSILCTTCLARLKVRSPKAIGEILECPKCGSMVQITPPEGWVPPPPEPVEPEPVKAKVAVAAGAAVPLGGIAKGDSIPGVDLTDASLESLEGATPHAMSDLGAAAEPLPAAGPAPLQASPAELLWRKWLLLAAAPVVVVVLAFGLWSMFSGNDSPESETAQQPAEPAPPKPDPKTPAEDPGPNVPDELSPGLTPPDEPGPATEPQPTDPEPPADPPEDGTTDPDPANPPEEPIDPPEEPNDPVDPPDPPADPVDNPPPVERPELVQVDVQARLADTVAEVELTQVPLADAVEFLSQLSTVPITLDVDAMQQLGVTPRDPVSVGLTETTVGRILGKMISDRGLAAEIDDGQVLVTSPAERRQTLRQRRYTLHLLVGDKASTTAELAAMVRKLVAPASWDTAGGRGTVAPDGNALAVVQTAEVHHHILFFCEKLRVARGLSPRSRINPDLFKLDTRHQRARRALSLPVTVNFHHPAPLQQIAAHLEEPTGLDILFDRVAMARQRWSPTSEASVNAEKEPLGVVLRQLLDPMGLAYRVIDAKTLQITTAAAASARMQLEFYPVGKLLGNGRPAAELSEQIRTGVAPTTWTSTGGPGVLYFDESSTCLIVLQSQPAQVALGRLLAEEFSQARAEK
ncbi:MAG: hypothetical protein HQ567_03720 [Candidatus Nealsonbacteria bacterium]|nr:hypothetical protein [Candidatus Nealsonbacteria bacterium]